MKTITVLLVTVIAASLLLAQPAEAQKRDTIVTISSFSVVGPPPHARRSQIHHGQPARHGAYQAQRPYRSNRHAVRDEQTRMAEWYASTTMAQVTHARRVGCAGSHPRWSTSYQDHYNWAYTSSRNQIMREVDRRDRQLASCGYYRR
ncbi:MAG: hypothetical protein ACNA7J_13110 [Wenzhouxiangella sp.]